MADQGREQPPPPRKKHANKKPPRLKVCWGIFNERFQRVALFEYNMRKEAEEAMRKLDSYGEMIHFVRIAKVARG